MLRRAVQYIPILREIQALFSAGALCRHRHDSVHDSTVCQRGLGKTNTATSKATTNPIEAYQLTTSTSLATIKAATQVTPPPNKAAANTCFKVLCQCKHATTAPVNVPQAVRTAIGQTKQTLPRC